MNTDQWKQVKDLFDRAIDLPLQEREAYVQNSGDPEEIRTAALEMLRADNERSGEELDQAIRGVARDLVRSKSPKLPEPGELVGPYEVEKLIGKGGVGRVFLAHDTRLERKVALKFYAVSSNLLDSSSRPRFEREVKAASALNHPNILTVFDVGAHDGASWVATEYIEGPTLRERLKLGTVPVDEALDIAEQLLSALDAAHRANIVHRDIKPENVMVRGDGLVKLVDFGLAKSVSSPMSKPLTDSGNPDETAFGGTIRYMSPEQASGKTVDARTDLWSTGVLLHELITDKHLITGRAPDTILQNLLDLKKPPVAHDSFPKALLLFLSKALAISPNERFASAAEMLTALRDARKRLQAPRRWWWITGAAAAVLMTLGGGFWLWRQTADTGLLSARQLTFDQGYSGDPTVSRDGKWIVFVSDRNSGRLGLWKVPADGSKEPESILSGEYLEPHEPTFHPNGRDIAFQSGSEAPSIHLTTLDGGQDQLLSASGTSPRFSPDGNWMLYSSQGDRGGYGQVWVERVGGAEQRRQIVPDFADAHLPVWSEDGKSILFCGTRISGDPTQEHDWWVVPFPAGVARKSGAGADPFLNDFRGFIHRVGGPSAWRDGHVYLANVAAGKPRFSIWRVPFDPTVGLGKVKTELVSSAKLHNAHPSFGGKTIAFHRGENTASIWEIPIDEKALKTTGPPRQIAETEGNLSFPHLNVNGDLVFVESHVKRRVLLMREIGKGQSEAKPVLSGTERQDFPRWSRDGRQLAMRVMVKPQVPIVVVDPATGESRTACKDCGGPADWSPDGKHLLFEPGASIAYVGRLNLETGLKEEDYIKPRGNSLRGARYSPDGQFIAFQEELPKGVSRILIAPIQKRDQWISITGGFHEDTAPAWSPDGQAVYYLSNQSGLRSVWAQRLKPTTREPDGPPSLVHRVSQWNHTVLETSRHASPFVGLDIYPGKIILAMEQIRCNIWAADLPPVPAKPRGQEAK